MQSLPYFTPENATRLTSLAEVKGKTVNELLAEIFQDFKSKPNHTGVTIDTAHNFYKEQFKKVNETLPNAIHTAKIEAAREKEDFLKRIGLVNNVINVTKNIANQLKENNLVYDNETTPHREN